MYLENHDNIHYRSQKWTIYEFILDYSSIFSREYWYWFSSRELETLHATIIDMHM